jgi:hypothetical protein
VLQAEFIPAGPMVVHGLARRLVTSDRILSSTVPRSVRNALAFVVDKAVRADSEGKRD